MAAPEILLTEEQRLEFMQISQNISEWEISKYYTFSDYDMEIINRHRRDYNRLGFAVQLCCLRNPGWTLGSINEIPSKVLQYIAEQLQVSPKEFEQYAQRENTRFEHLQELREEYGYRNFSEIDSSYISEYLMPFAMENDNPGRLIGIALEEIKKKMVILPGITTIEKIVLDTIQQADNIVISTINKCLSDLQKKRLDELIETIDENNKTS